MAVPGTPTSFYVQQGDAQVYLSWAITPTATSYQIQRSTDGVTFTNLATSATNSYLDTTVTIATLYYYQVAGINGSGTGSYTLAQSIVPCAPGQECLGNMRLYAQQRADQVNSNFVTLPEWNKYITESYKELYDILIQKFGDDYFSANYWMFVTSGNTQLYQLPDGVTVTTVDTGLVVPAFYKATLIEVALNPQDPNSWVTLREYQRIQQNLWNYPNVYTFRGVTNLRYRFTGNNIQLVPQTQAGQYCRVWYAPRPKVLKADTDTIDGVSGWEEYIVVDAAIKALVKKESDTSMFAAQKAALMLRIENAAENRNIAEPEVVSDSKMRNLAWTDDSGFGSGGGFYG